MNFDFEYDRTNPKSIEEYAKKLIGHTFKEVDGWNIPGIYGDVDNTYANKSRKGGLGNFIEERFFCYKANSDSNADFSEAGVELKVTPYEIKKKGNLSAGERLVLTMISYEHEVELDFFNSHLWDKCRLILLIYYLRDKTLKSNMDYRIDFAQLFTPPEADLKIIIEDYKTIIDKVSSGRANELSESDTMYLGACTKGANAEKSTVPQAYYAPDVKARKPARTMLTSESTTNRSSHIIKDPECDRMRIITPIEAERIQGFDDNWTNTMPNRNRYFCMGNALVVPMVTRMGRYLGKIFDEEEMW